MKNILMAVPCFLLVLFAVDGFSQATVPPAEQVDFLLRILKYNKTITESGGTEIRVAIVYSDNQESKTSYQAYDDALFEKVKAKEEIVGKKMSYSGILFTSGAEFLKALGAMEFSVFLVIEGNDDNLADINSVAQAKGIMTFTGVKPFLSRGVASGVENVAGQNKVVINIDAANSAGTSFKAALLSIAKVIKS